MSATPPPPPLHRLGRMYWLTIPCWTCSTFELMSRLAPVDFWQAMPTSSAVVRLEWFCAEEIPEFEAPTDSRKAFAVIRDLLEQRKAGGKRDPLR